LSASKPEDAHKHHNIDCEAIRGKLFLNSFRDKKQKLITATMERRDPQIAGVVKDALTKALINNRIDILIIDPLIKAHRIPENGNALMDAVVTTVGDIGDDANCSVELTQRARKTSCNDVTVEDARGASATSRAIWPLTCAADEPQPVKARDLSV
jgi:hypothetical protein